MTYYLNTEKTFGMLAFLLFFLNVSIAQVGINTTSPNANSALDVNGRVIVQDLSRTGSGISGVGILLVEQDGTLIKADLSSDLITIDGSNEITINNTFSSSTTEKIVLFEERFQTKNNWDLDLGGANSDVTVFIIRKDSGNDELKIRGIAGGTEGRKIKIINDSGEDIKFDEDHNNATNGNKIYIYTSDNKMEEYGTCELIYSTDVSSGSGHWCFVQLDKYN